jgi:COP9 signalosome complex subunit 2
MSDYGNEYEQEWGSDGDAAEGDGRNETEIEIENTYYEAEGIMKTQKNEALEKFETVILLEEQSDKVAFSFLAIRHVVILTMQLGLYEKMVESLKQMLRMSLKVSKNDLTEAVNLVQDAIQKTLTNQPEQAREMYQLILGNLKSNNERLWFATSLRLGKIYLDEKSFEKLDQTLSELKIACRDPNDAMNPDSYDMKKGNLLLEVFALEI